MSDLAAFRRASEAARKQADRLGLSMNWARWDAEHGLLSWTGIPRREAKAAAAPEFELAQGGKRGLLL